jgi:2-methylcitrate dehydratase PrpD
MTAAETLARFCSSLRWEDLSLHVRERTKDLVLDFLGVAARGSAEESSRAAARCVWELQPSGDATVVGAGFGSGATWAALVNGTAGHAIELDDVTTESSLHPGVAIIPAALAVAEERDRTPARFLEAVVAGYEVTMRVGNALNPAAAYRRGFHPTGVAGVFGATTAAGCLLDLDEPRLVRALGIAGTLAAGSLEYLADGSYTKRLNAGWAAHAGIVAAGLARAGFTGPATVFEGELGALHAFSDAAIPERLLRGVPTAPSAATDEALQIMRVSIKPYACCRYNHGLIDCVLQLRREHRIRPEDVAAVRLGVLSGGSLLVAEPIERKRAPTNVVDAQFSAPFAAAVALVRGAAGFPEYSPATLADPTIHALMARTECYRDPALDADYPRRWPAGAEIHLTDGRTVATRIDYATGEPENPVSRSALIDKFVSLSAKLLDASDAHRLAEQVLELDDAPDLRSITALLRGSSTVET